MDFPRRAPSLPRSLAAGAVIVCGQLSGCTSYGPAALHPGDNPSAVLQRMGEPAQRRTLPAGGQRWVYARGPLGYHTWMLDFDKQDRLQSWFDALEPARLAAIEPGMTEAAVAERLGPPAQKRRLALEGRSMWAWRFVSYDCLWFVTTFDAGGTVLDAGYAPDPRCDVDRD